MIVQFPSSNPNWARKKDPNAPEQWHKYYSTHPQYVLNLLWKGGCKVQMLPATNWDCRSTVSFDCFIDGHLCKFDFNDHEVIDRDVSEKYRCYFKFHYHESHDVGPREGNLFPFSPVNFHDWDLYWKLAPSIQYQAKGKVLNNQAPAGNAIDRRKYVAKILRERYGKNLDTDRYPQKEFFKLIRTAGAIVCVPGARNNMLDRGQGQQMFFGACTISPKLNTRLSFHSLLMPGEHYIECKPDYSDLITKIEWVNRNREKAILIGKQAQKLFVETSTPKRQMDWINQCVHRK